MPRNRRSRRNFEKKFRSGVWKACAGASAMAAVIAVQTGVAPAFAAPTTRYVDLNVEDNGTSALSLREAIALANPGDIIDISGAGDDIWVNGTITIDTELTIVGAGDGVQQIHSYAKSASNWNFNEVDLNRGGDDNNWGYGDSFFRTWADNEDTVVGNTIFEIVGQVDNATDEVVDSTVVFKDVAISGFAADPDNLDYNNYESEGVYHNYTALVTVDESHHGEVIFDGATLEDSYVTSMAKGYELYQDNENMYVWFAAASGLASYSDAEGGLEATKISFINDSQIYNLSFNLEVDWDDQFQVKYYIDSDGLGGGTDSSRTYHWDGANFGGFSVGGDNTYTGAVDITNMVGNDYYSDDWQTQSAVFSKFGDIAFVSSSAENNSVFDSDNSGTWDVGSSDGAVFGIYEGNLTITDSTIVNNYHETGDGGVAYLDEGNLYISALTNGQTDINGNRTANGDGGAFFLDDGKFEIVGDVVFDGNWAENGGAIYGHQNIPDDIYNENYFSFVGDGVEFNNNKADYNGGAIYMDGWLRVRGIADDGIEFYNNFTIDGDGGAIYQYDGPLQIKNASFVSNDAQDDSGEGQGRGGALYIGIDDSFSFTEVKLSNLSFFNNTAEYSGGAIAVDQEDFDEIGRTDFIVNESSFGYNYSGDEGGAIYFGNAVINATIQDSSFNFNESDEEGAAVFFDTYYNDSDETYLNIVDSVFDKNRTDRAGGAVFTFDKLTVEGSAFYSNISDDSSGGAIFTSDGGFIRTSYFTGNMADYSGGAIFTENDVLAVYESNFFRNGWDIRGEGWNGHPINAYTYEDTNDGGAIYSDNEDLLVFNSDFDANFAADEGGAIYSNGWEYIETKVIGTSFVSNYANNEGSAIYADGDIFVINSTLHANKADSGEYAIYSNNESVYIAMSTIVNENVDGPDSYLIYADDDVHIFGSIIAANNGAEDLIIEDDSDFYDDGYNLVTDPSALQNGGMDLGTPLENKSMWVNWEDLDFDSNGTGNWGSYADTAKIGAESVAIRYIRGNRVDVDWLNWDVWFPAKGDDGYVSINSLIGDDARGTHRGNLMDVGAYEVSIMSGGGGSVDASPAEPVVEPTPTPTPEALDPVVANVRGFAPGSAKLTKALKATIKSEVAENAAYKAVVLRGFTVTAADFALAKARATAVKNYILKLVPEMATKVLKGKLGQSRKVKLTFKETL